MKWSEISIQTTHEATEAIAEIFHDLGASGVVIEDPELINTYRRSGSWDFCDIPEETDVETVTVKAYLPMDEELDQKMAAFETRINELSTHELDKGKGAICCREVQEEDWASSWKEFFHPVRISNSIVIKPSWEDYEAAVNDIVIELDPGMAFGTGTHHTTAMCTKCLEDIVQPEHVVFDVGTGSGILAIAAAKLGASRVQAVDLDPVAVRVAKENVAMNQADDIITVSCGDLLTGVEGQADVIVANIIADIIIYLLGDVTVRLKPGGCLIASGIIVERLSDVTAAVLENNLIVEKVTEEGGWVAMVIRKGGV